MSGWTAPSWCKAAKCQNEAVPGTELCDYHLDMEESGETVERKVRRLPGRPKKVITPEEIEARNERRREKDRLWHANKRGQGKKPESIKEMKARIRSLIAPDIQRIAEEKAATFKRCIATNKLHDRCLKQAIYGDYCYHHRENT